MKISSGILVAVIILPLLMIAGMLSSANESVYLLRLTPAASPEELYWVVDLNGGEIRAGDEIEAYFYNDAIAIGASKRFKAFWNPGQLSRFELSKLVSDKSVYDGSVLNINAGGSYEFRVINSAERDRVVFTGGRDNKTLAKLDLLADKSGRAW